MFISEEIKIREMALRQPDAHAGTDQDQTRLTDDLRMS